MSSPILQISVQLQGLALVILGTALAFGLRPLHERIASGSLPWLAGSAFAQATAAFLAPLVAKGLMPALVPLTAEALAAALLLRFAIGLMAYAGGTAPQPIYRSLPVILFTLWLAAQTALPLAGEIGYRLVLAAPAALLAALALHRARSTTSALATRFSAVALVFLLLAGLHLAASLGSLIPATPLTLITAAAWIALAWTASPIPGDFSAEEGMGPANAASGSDLALHFSEEKFRNLFHASQDGAFLSDAQTGLVVDANQAAGKLLGVPMEKVIGLYLKDALVGEAARPVIDLFGPASQTDEKGTAIRGECEAKTLHGIMVPVEFTASRFSIDHWDLVQTICRNISTRKEQERTLSEARESLKAAQRIAHLGSWTWNLEDDACAWSDETCRIFGLDPAHAKPGYDAFFSFVHKEDREALNQAVQNAVEDNASLRMEHRIQRNDGSVRRVLQVGEVYRDAKNHPTRVLGVMHDITELRQAEDQLQVTRKIFESAFEGAVITDTRGVIESINPAFQSVTGYLPHDLLGKPIQVLNAPDGDPAFPPLLNTILRETGKDFRDVMCLHKIGSPFPKRLTVTSIPDTQGKTKNYVALFHDLTALKKSEKELHRQAYHDRLTGLPNINLFKDRLDRAIVHAERNNGKVAVIQFGLDGFKKINESLGVTYGDTCLKHLSMRLKSAIRNADTISRLGGDEFAFILRDVINAEDILVVVKKIIESMSRPFMIQGRRVFFTASMGVTLFPEDGTDVVTLIKNAHMAVGRAKAAGGDNYQFFTTAMADQASQRLSLEEKLRTAVGADEFVPFYQPKIDLKTGRISGMESLVRWFPPEGKMISPGDFIPVAEETGLIIPLGEAVLKASCVQTRTWNEAGYGPLKVAVNLSARQFRQKNLVDRIRDILDETGLPPEHLELEITESMVMGDVEETIAILEQLKAMRLNIAIDDFGTGYSSLNYLKRFPIDTLKIDRSFVRDLTVDSDDAAIVSAIVSMSHDLNLKVVAEGVETSEQLDYLKEKSCDVIQGYYYSPPLNAEKFQAYMDEQKKPKKDKKD